MLETLRDLHFIVVNIMQFTLASSSIKSQTLKFEKSTTLVIFYNMIFQPHWLRQFSN